MKHEHGQESILQFILCSYGHKKVPLLVTSKVVINSGGFQKLFEKNLTKVRYINVPAAFCIVDNVIILFWIILVQYFLNSKIIFYQ